MITKIDIGLNKINKIYHLADIHIRNLKRHKEYQVVFERTVEAIKATLQPNDIIFLGGDIVHAKTDMTPELIQSVQSFFKMFADIAPTILITGNHDCNLNNKSRLDALTPIVNALNHPNLFYLKDSGVYEIADKHFTVMSVFDKPKDFIRADQFNGDYKIALHHGAVNNALTDIGFRLVNDHVDLKLFEGYELVLLGDIHKPEQYLNAEKTVAFPGSLIQQNYAEALVHGMLVWDTATKKADFVVIENDICYYTLEINSNTYTPIPDTLKGKLIRLRIKAQDTENADLKTIIGNIKSEFNIEEVVIQRVNDFTKNKQRVQKINIGDVRDVEYQNELITKYLENKFALDEVVLDGIRHVNRTVNSTLVKSDSSRNISWIPKRFEFSNMFSYGANNVIDFTNMKGVYGIFAPNASGKSTMLDSITYCIFDKCGRTSKASAVMNNKADSFKCKFEFELDGKLYVIEKKGSKGRGSHVRVDVDFYSIDEFNQKESLNGKERSETNDNIRNLLGTYEDFVLTALSVQNNNSGFIDMAQKDRKDLLSQFLDINIFEDLYAAGNNEIKEVAVLVKEYQKQDFGAQLAEAISEIDNRTQDVEFYKNKIQDLNNVITVKDQELLHLTETLTPVDPTIEDITKLQTLENDLNIAISHSSITLDGYKQKVSDLEAAIQNLQDNSNAIDINELNNKLSILNTLKDQERILFAEVGKLKIEVNNKLDKMAKLEDLEYDENCQYCMNNIFVKDAIETKASIESAKQEARDLVDKLNTVKEEIESLNSLQHEKAQYDTLQKEIHTTASNKNSSEVALHQEETKLTQLQSKLELVKQKIEEYYRKESIITENKQIKDKINIVKQVIQELKLEVADYTHQLTSVQSDLLVAMRLKERTEADIEKLKQLEQQNKFYQYYLEAVNRDGVPYDLITTAVPYIEQEINNILSQIVEFRLMLEMDGKNINCYIVYENDNFWPIELTSGMEKFVSSLAIRTALINVSTLPRPNFLAIDEGFGVLDSDNLNSVFNLFDYLKTQFSFMLVISHIDSMRDVVDHLIEIVKTNGNSKISYE
jgi:DNA repair exonuclease SbcCD ATPase subunit/DNA repair exonuclease SbcCD nuclease subunit